jgi:hypothetical protein
MTLSIKAEHCYAECYLSRLSPSTLTAECHYAECRYAECHGALKNVFLYIFMSFCARKGILTLLIMSLDWDVGCPSKDCCLEVL